MDAGRMIRRALEDDIPRITDMVGRLAASVSGPQAVCRIRTGETLARLIHTPTGAVWRSERGFIAGEIVQTVISSEPVAVELGWWSEDRSGLRLLRAFEGWAREQGATLIKLSANGGPAEKLLAANGYRPAETAWVK